MDVQSPRMQGVEHWLIRCGNCGHIDDTYKLLDFASYGRAIGRTSSGEIVEFSAWEGTVFEELLGIVRMFKDNSDRRRRDCFNMVMSLVVNPSPRGEQFRFFDSLRCSQCGSSSNLYKPADPMDVLIELPLVTHREWERLSQEEKVKLVEEGLRSRGCIE